MRGAAWIVSYALVALAPLAVVLLGPTPESRGFWRELAAGLGYVGLSVLCLQFLLVGRFRRVAAPFGIDIVLQFHRRISFVALGLVLAHPVITMLAEPSLRPLLDPIGGPWRARAAWLAVLCLLALVATSVWRQRLGLGYEVWQAVHGLLSVGVVGFSLGHVLGVEHYLALPWKAILWSAFAAAVVLVLVYLRLIKPALVARRPYRVASVRPERGDCFTLALRPSGHEGLRFAPGQFAWIRVGSSPFGIFENPFSFSGSAERAGELEFTIKALGDFTRTVEHLSPGAVAYVDGPYGVFTPRRRPHASGFAYVAGGIGITPIVSILRTFADQHDRRPHLLAYASEDWERVTFREELEALRGRLDLEIVYVLDNPPEQPPSGAKIEAGLVTREVLQRHLPADRLEREYFLCGPPPMMQAVSAALEELGVPPDRIELESFDLV